MPIEAILFDLDNTLLLEDDATEDALRRTSELAARRTGGAKGSIHAAAREAAESLFAASPHFAYSEAMGIWWGEALWGDFAGDGEEIAALRAFVPGFRHAVWRRALRGVDGDALVDEVAAAFRDIRRALRPIDPAGDGKSDGAGDGKSDGAIVPNARIGALGELRSTLTALERADPFPQPA